MIRPAAIILLFSLIGLNACTPDTDAPCRDVHIVKNEFSSEQAALLPYTGKDSLYFRTGSSDSVLCIVQGEASFYNGVPIAGNPECAADSNGFRGITRTMKDSLAKLVFTYSMTRIDSMIRLEVNGSALAIRFHDLSTDSANASHRDSIFFEKVFYNVHTFANAQGDSFYYSKSEGLIRHKNGTTEFTLYSKR